MCVACAVMALERIPSGNFPFSTIHLILRVFCVVEIRAHGGVSRMTDPKLIKQIKAAVTIPVMAKVRIGHFVEAQILEALDIDFVDESEVVLCSGLCVLFCLLCCWLWLFGCRGCGCVLCVNCVVVRC